MNNIIFIDTETNGKPRNYQANMRELENWPRVIQLAWVVYSPAGERLLTTSHLVKPDGWTIPTETFWIEHGYSTEKNMEQGLPMLDVLAQFCEAAKECDTIVAHNMQFDFNVLGAEMLRYGVTTGKKLHRVCTMEAGTDICKLPHRSSRHAGNYGSYKWPSLAELHTKLFGQGFDGAHDALADVEACARCYFEMKKLKNKQ